MSQSGKLFKERQFRLAEPNFCEVFSLRLRYGIKKLPLDFNCQLVSKQGRDGVADLGKLPGNSSSENIPVGEGLQPCALAHREGTGDVRVQVRAAPAFGTSCNDGFGTICSEWIMTTLIL